jgi:hypothetical protein
VATAPITASAATTREMALSRPTDRGAFTTKAFSRKGANTRQSCR